MPTVLESLWHVVQAELAGAVSLAPPPLGLHDELQRQLVQRRLRAGTVLFGR